MFERLRQGQAAQPRALARHEAIASRVAFERLLSPIWKENERCSIQSAGAARSHSECADPLLRPKSQTRTSYRPNDMQSAVRKLLQEKDPDGKLKEYRDLHPALVLIAQSHINIG